MAESSPKRKQGRKTFAGINCTNPRYELNNISTQNLSDIDEYENALKSYDWNKLEDLIDAGADYTYCIDGPESPDTSALFYSGFYYQNDLVKVIIKKHEETKRFPERFELQCTRALWGVCINNNWELVDILIEAGAKIIEDNHPHTAAENGTWRVLEEIKKNSELNLDAIDDERNTPLYYASKNGHIHTINWLLDNGASVNEDNSYGNTALHIACLDADEDSVQLLIKRGAEINVINHKGETPIFNAARTGKQGHIAILAREKANLDQRDDNGTFPLLLACENGHTNAIEELITNGASLKVTNEQRYNCLERAIHSRKDSSAAMCVRLDPSEDFINEYKEKYEIPMNDLAKYDMIETLNALLDRMVVVKSEGSGKKNIKGQVLTKYLDIDSNNYMPGDEKYERNDTYLLQRISQFGNDRIAYHGTIRLLVDKKMNIFGYHILAIKTIFFILFLFTLGYSLIQASYQILPSEKYTVNFGNGLRLATELFTVFYFITNFITEAVEFLRVMSQTNKHWKKKKYNPVRVDTDQADNKESSKWKILEQFKKKMNNNIFIRVIIDYFRDKSNYLDVLGLLTLFILFILRLISQPIQWVFAAVTFFINAMRLFKLIVLIPVLGPYSTIIYKVLKNDVPKFAALFLITLFTFTGTFFIALRAPYTVEGLHNASLMQDTRRAEGIDNEVWWVLFSGLRILVQGNVYEEMYIYNSLNWLAAIVYLSFLFLTLIVYINVFIAQLTETYAKFKQRADYRFAWHRLNFIVQVQRTSFLSIFMDLRKKFFIKSITIDKDTLNEYYNVNDIKHLNLKSFNENVDVKNMLSSIQMQQKTSLKVKSAIGHTECLNEFKSLQKKIDSNKEYFDEKMVSIIDQMDQMKIMFGLIDKRTEQMFEMLVKFNPSNQPAGNEDN